MSLDFNQGVDERTNLLPRNQRNTIFFSSFSSPGSNRSYGSLSSCQNIFQSIWSRNKQKI
ncbi:kinase D-interacting substrate of 220 kDa isoform X2 [Vespula squamosa]|uniref:Kinase D-interacting substrate of 220 kDa isoform X2 n=1 Tax=Vespula squamosa TaxID=30214 RepID=A0ABD2ALS2_VESSQ